jgi:hypothetical protein
VSASAAFDEIWEKIVVSFSHHSSLAWRCVKLDCDDLERLQAFSDLGNLTLWTKVLNNVCLCTSELHQTQDGWEHGGSNAGRHLILTMTSST